MKWTTCRLRGSAWLVRLGLVIVLLGTGLARADFIFVGYNGITPYPPDETTVNFPPSPAVLDRVRPDAPRLGSGETIINSGSGQIKTSFVTAPLGVTDGGIPNSVGPFVVNARLDDTAEFRCSTGDCSKPITWGFLTVGTGVLPPTDSNNDLEYDIATTVLNLADGEHSATVQFANQPLEGFIVPALGAPFSFSLLSADTFTLSGHSVSIPFDFLLTASGLGGASLDLSHTAQLFFDLPPGVSVTTDGGFFQSGSAAVPEPSSILLLGAALVALVRYGARRKKPLGQK